MGNDIKAADCSKGNEQICIKDVCMTDCALDPVCHYVCMQDRCVTAGEGDNLCFMCCPACRLSLGNAIS